MVAIESRTPVVVCDAGPLIHLDELDCLELLSDSSSVQVPDAVWVEVERHRPQALTRPDVILHRHPSRPVIPEQIGALARLLSLHKGETEALALAASLDRATLLTDDAAARLAAKSIGLTAHGSIGIIIRGMRRGLRSKEQVLAILRSIPSRSTLHLKPQLLSEVIREVEEA